MQALPSSHAVPLAFGSPAQRPVAGSQVPTAQSLSKPLQSTGGALWHFPVVRLHVSAPSQALPLSHSESLVHGQEVGSVVQPPVVSSQASTVQAMPSLHTTCAPAQTPAVHTSNTVQTSPSLQLVPSWRDGKLH